MRKLTEFETYVIEQKGTERPFTGEYDKHDAVGIYHCKRCDAPLYLSEHKFNAHCGWPAFDDEIEGAVTRYPDADGRRVEIVCSQCQGHLGHVFEGEHLTMNNLRHCVNSVSLQFKSAEQALQHSSDSGVLSQQGESQPPMTAIATFGAGCFWCVEAIFDALDGVFKTRSGYTGGRADEATYKQVCSGMTAHAEVVQIEYDPNKISFETLLEVFFQSHDPTTLNRQGNDVGPQYRSAIFVHDQNQADLANEIIAALTQAQAYPAPVVTEVSWFTEFYPAEDYHNDYFANNGEQPYCQMVVKPKVDKVKAMFAKRLKLS